MNFNQPIQATGKILATKYSPSNIFFKLFNFILHLSIIHKLIETLTSNRESGMAHGSILYIYKHTIYIYIYICNIYIHYIKEHCRKTEKRYIFSLCSNFYFSLPCFILKIEKHILTIC